MAEPTPDRLHNAAPVGEKNIPAAQEDTASHNSENEKLVSSKSKKQKLPDWQPLGSVRDSFFEQMKQDNRY
jgi:hypothetical protein